jgi:hypothetical protein
MEDQWFTYSEAAEKLGVSRQAVRQKAIRGHWGRTRGNDGQARVQIPEQPYRVRTPSVLASTNPERVPDSQLVDALKSHIETLKADNEQLKGELSSCLQEVSNLQQQREAELVTERERADRTAADFVALAQRVTTLAEELSASKTRAAAAEVRTARAIDELLAMKQRLAIAQLRARPWWRRWRRAS